MGTARKTEQLLKQRALNHACVHVALREANIRAFLRRQNKLLVDFARGIGTSKNYSWQLITNRRYPSAPMRERIMLIFPEKTWDDLFEEVRM